MPREPVTPGQQRRVAESMRHVHPCAVSTDHNGLTIGYTNPAKEAAAGAERLRARMRA